MQKFVKASRAWKFVIRLQPTEDDDGTDMGNYTPPPFDPKWEVRFKRGQVQFSEIQPIDDDEPRNVEFADYFEAKEQVRLFSLHNWLPDADFAAAQVKDRLIHVKEVTDSFRAIKNEMACGVKWSLGNDDEGGQGKRTDYDKMKDIVKADGPIAGVKRIAEEYPSYFVRYHAGIQRLADTLEHLPSDDDFKPNPFQAAMIEELSQKPHPRHIYWIYDKMGHSGKSRLAKYLQCEMNAIELAGRDIDIAYAYNGQPIVLFDIPRAMPLTSYADAFTCAERIKNGGIFSSKFTSKFKRFEIPHVVFLSNQCPPMGIWTEDRLQLITIEGPASEPFQPFSFNKPPPPPKPYVPSRSDILAERMKELHAQYQEENPLTCIACVEKKPIEHTYQTGCLYC